MMNPFDLRGPEFLLFYAALIVASVVARYVVQAMATRSGAARRPLTDPYMIAYLRGGASEAVAVAAASLAHRDLVTVSAETISTAVKQWEVTSNSLEKAVLEECLTGKTLGQLKSREMLHRAQALYDDHLVRSGLILSLPQRRVALLLKVGAVMALLGIAVVKIAVAFSRGRRNVGFLMILASIGIIIHLLISFWRTPNGDLVLKDLRVLFDKLQSHVSQLKNRARNDNFTLLLAVFGVGGISMAEAPFLSAFRPKSSSGSSCGSSCGSGCGGGGCGGGCGGCGS